MRGDGSGEREWAAARRGVGENRRRPEEESAKVGDNISSSCGNKETTRGVFSIE